MLADSHPELHPLVDELLAALNVTGARRVRPHAGAALSLAGLAAGADAVGVSADRLVLPCRAPSFHPRLWRQARYQLRRVEAYEMDGMVASRALLASLQQDAPWVLCHLPGCALPHTLLHTQLWQQASTAAYAGSARVQHPTD